MRVFGFVSAVLLACRGGCDSCAAAASGVATKRDVGPQARLLLATVQRLREKGLGTAVSVLQGSK